MVRPASNEHSPARAGAAKTTQDMKKVRVLIERGRDGSYGAYIPDSGNLGYTIIGDGATARQARQDFMEVYEAFRQDAAAEGETFREAEFTFGYDVPSFLLYYAELISYKGLARLTGIAPAQLSQYISGYRKPSAKTTAKIQEALHRLGEDLSHVQLV